MLRVDLERNLPTKMAELPANQMALLSSYAKRGFDIALNTAALDKVDARRSAKAVGLKYWLNFDDIKCADSPRGVMRFSDDQSAGKPIVPEMDEESSPGFDRFWLSASAEIRHNLAQPLGRLENLWGRLVYEQTSEESGRKVEDCMPCFSKFNHLPAAMVKMFAREVMGLGAPSESTFEALAKMGDIYQFGSRLVICANPIERHADSQGRPHCEGGPAILYKDGFAVWALDGVRVPPHWAIKKTEELDWYELGSIREIGMRNVFLNRIGVRRIVAGLPDPLKSFLIRSYSSKRKVELEGGPDVLRQLSDLISREG